MKFLAGFITALLVAVVGVLLAVYLAPETEIAASIEGPADVPEEFVPDLGDGIGPALRPAAGVIKIGVTNKGPQIAQNVEASVEVIVGYRDPRNQLSFCRLLNTPVVKRAAVLGTGATAEIIVRHIKLRQADNSVPFFVNVCVRRDGLLPIDGRYTRINFRSSVETEIDEFQRAEGKSKSDVRKLFRQPEVSFERRLFFNDVSCREWDTRIRGVDQMPACQTDQLVKIVIAPETSSPFIEADWMPAHGWKDLDGNCRDGRQDVLFRQSTVPPELTANGCAVLRGRWVDAYTGEVATDPADVEIDHLVSLKEANDSGGSVWPSQRKSAFAQDITRGNVFVVLRTTNRRKWTREPDEWHPEAWPQGCGYMRSWIQVKAHWGLTMDANEVAYLRRTLEWCDSKRLTETLGSGSR